MSYDLLLGYTTKDIPLQRGIITTGRPTPYLAVGLQRTATQWMKCLLTLRGTDVTDPGYGTGLAALINGPAPAGQLLLDICAQAVSEATQQIVAIQSRRQDQLTVDERLSSARILSLVRDSGGAGFGLSVQLTSVSGATIPSLVPILTAR